VCAAIGTNVYDRRSRPTELTDAVLDNELKEIASQRIAGGIK
jgi:hypothetical protein